MWRLRLTSPHLSLESSLEQLRGSVLWSDHIGLTSDDVVLNRSGSSWEQSFKILKKDVLSLLLGHSLVPGPTLAHHLLEVRPELGHMLGHLQVSLSLGLYQ